MKQQQRNYHSFADMQIEPLQLNDIQYLANLQPKDWGDIIPHLAYYINNPTCQPVKVAINAEVAGIGTVLFHQDVAWLAHIIVYPHYRGRGVGTFITSSLIEIARRRQCNTIYLIATDLGYPVYSKLGFVTETEYLGFKDGKYTPDVEASFNIFQFDNSDRQKVLQLDATITGEQRSMRLESHLANAYVYTNGSTVQGYYLPTYGEGWIAAENHVAGIALMRHRFERAHSVILPAENETAIQFLQANGYQQFTSRRRMILGQKRSWQPQNIYSRIGGQIG
jgi:GNAT superfamily N-acetyltransferase